MFKKFRYDILSNSFYFNSIGFLKSPYLKRPLNNIENALKYSSNSNNQIDPLSRCVNKLRGDFIQMKNFVLGRRSPAKKVHPNQCDVFIVGGGVMGCSIAYWLKERALEGLNVVVIEKDPTVKFNNNLDTLKYQQSTSLLSVGGLRQQFSLEENIQLSLFSAEFMRNIKHYLSVEGEDPPDIQFHPTGYLFLATDKSAHILKENYDLQSSLGAKVELLSPERLKSRFPWMNPEDIALGCHGLENEGWFDPHSLLFAFRKKAESLGVHFVHGELVNFQLRSEPNLVVEDFTPKLFTEINHAVLRLADGSETEMTFGSLVIAAGGLSGQVASLAGVGRGPGPLAYPLPVEPRKRYVFNIHCPEGPGIVSPFLIDPSGAYFRREGLMGHYLCGMSPPDDEEPPIDNLDVDYDFFEKKLWPILAKRVPAFEKVKLKSAWAGFYDYNKFDENAFIGQYPGYRNVYLATGFSGHGIQQSPAVGRAMMEIIVDGEYKTIDLSRLHVDRYLDQKPLYESNIV